jgi:hypothetical protein
MFPVQMKKARNLLLLAGILAYIVLFTASPLLHNHNDAEQHDDCQVCQWALVCFFVFSIILTLLFSLFFCRKAIAYAATLLSVFCRINLHLRSPPSIFLIF